MDRYNPRLVDNVKFFHVQFFIKCKFRPMEFGDKMGIIRDLKQQ